MQEFKGKLLVSIREYYDDDAGERRPGRKGLYNKKNLDYYNLSYIASLPFILIL